MSPETRFRIESRTKCIDLHYSTTSPMSSAKLKFNCAREEQFFGHPRHSFSTWRTCLVSSTIVALFSLPSPGGVFALHGLLYARRITRRIVCDNDNQRVKWGLIFFGCGGEWRKKREIETRMAGKGKKEENACIHLPRNTQACTQHRRTLVDRKGHEGGQEGGKRGEKRVNARAWTGTQEYPEHARTTCNWVQSSWFSCEIFLRSRRSIEPLAKICSLRSKMESQI